MAVTPDKFQQLATKLLDGTFSSFKKPLTMKQTVPAEYPNPSTMVEQTSGAIQLESDFNKFDGQLIQVGDVMVITKFQDWTTVKPRTDLTSVNFDGTEYQIMNFQSDPADATYTIQLRPK